MADIRKYQILLENIGKSVESDGNWNDIEQLFRDMNNLMQDYPKSVKYIISYYFYDIIYWRQNKKSRVAPMQMMKLQMMEMDCNIALHNEDVVLWAMLEGAVGQSDERELLEFLDWFLDNTERNENAWSKTGQGVRIEYMEKQAGMLLILLEHRLQIQGVEEKTIINKIEKLWELGKNNFVIEEGRAFNEMPFFAGTVSNNTNMQLFEIVQSLKNDYQSNTRMSLIANIICVDGGKNE